MCTYTYTKNDVEVHMCTYTPIIKRRIRANVHVYVLKIHVYVVLGVTCSIFRLFYDMHSTCTLRNALYVENAARIRQKKDVYDMFFRVELSKNGAECMS